MQYNDSIEIIEENLNSFRVNQISQEINLLNKRLWCFSLRKCKINDIEYEKLISSLKKCKYLRYVNLSLNIIDSFHRVKCIATLIPNLSYLDTLCLHSSNLKDDGLKVLYFSLITCDHLHSLDIGDCDLTDDSISIIKDLIHRKEHSKGLNELIISCNSKITPIGWSQILIAVAAAADLKYLHIDYNNLDDNCGYLISAILTSNQSLEVLDLEQTGLTNKTAKLLNYLVKNYCLTIKTLNLLHNKIDEVLMKEIDKSIMNKDKIESTENHNKFIEPYKFKPVVDQNINEKARKSHVNQSFQNSNFVDTKKKAHEVLNEYEEMLATDFKSKSISSNGSFDDYELIIPSDDLRFKKHAVLPFNIK